LGKYSYNFSNTIYDVDRPPVAIDFSSGDPELVVFNRPDKIIRPVQNKITLGSYISMNELDGIITNDVHDRNYYSVFTAIQKQDDLQVALTEDFDLLRDFFQIDFFLEVENYCRSLLPKIKVKVQSVGANKLTPRKRRTYILAVIKSFAKKIGRDFTQNLLEEINDRFTYTRRIKLFEVSNAEQELIDDNFLIRPDLSQNHLKRFYLNFITNLNRLRANPIIAENKDYLTILSLTQKHVTQLATNKTQKKVLAAFIKHQDKDFVSRMIIWVVACYFAKANFDLTFNDPQEIAGWDTLFMVRISNKSHPAEQVPIRSFKFIFWNQFHFKTSLIEADLYPGENSLEEKKEGN